MNPTLPTSPWIPLNGYFRRAVGGHSGFRRFNRARERRSVLFGRILLWASLWLGHGGGIAWAQNAEQLAYEAAVRDFDLGQWERAALNLADFETQFPRSPLKLDVAQRKLLAQAEADFDRADYATAAKEFAAYQQGFPGMPRAPLAGVREAAARIKLGDRTGALAVLEAPEGSFAKALAAGGEPVVLFSGLLLKADALRGESRLVDTEEVLNQAAPFARSPAEQQTRLQALVAVQESMDRFEAAATTAEHLEQALGNSGRPDQRAEAAALAGRLWTRAGQMERAQAALARNTTNGVPATWRRAAVVQLADSALAQGDLTGARERLERFLAVGSRGPEDAPLQLRLGQMLFRQYLRAGGGTNASAENRALLGLAGAQFEAALTNAPAPAVAGPLNLGRGWTLWEEAVAANNPDRFRAAATHFAAAAALLPHSPEQATARFKLADIWFRLKEPAAALTNYLAVAREYSDLPVVQQELVEAALQQAAEAAVEAGNAAEAARVVEQLLVRKPAFASAGDTALLVGQALAKTGDAAGAKVVLRRFLEAYPGSPLTAEVELALIAADLRALSWTNAIRSLDHWIGVYTNHPSLARAEFDRAWASARAGQATNAVEQFAALAARYPTNTFAETASLWLAGHYFSLGEFARAEQACVNIVTNTAWRGTPLWYQARLWAAEAARRYQKFASARDQLTDLLNDRETPASQLPSALFALGETRLEQPPAAGQPPLQNFQQALEAFTAAAQYTNSVVSVAAFGKMADCHLQLATQVTNSYPKAEELYHRVLESPMADISARSKAAFGLALVAEKVAAGPPAPRAEALLKEALNRYLDIVNGALLRPGETADPWWVKEAGREAGRLLESRGLWNEAATLYDRLARELPPLHSTWELRAREVRRHAQDRPVAAASP